MKVTIGLLLIIILSTFSLKGTSQEVTIEKAPFDSPEHDYSATFYKDGIIFCSTREKRQFMNMDDGIYYTDLYYIDVNGDEFGEPTPFLGKVRSRLNDGPGTFNKSQDEFIYTSNLGATSGTSSTLGLFTTKDKNGVWQRRTNFDYNSKETIVAHPSLSLDGTMLVFAANFEDAKGGSIDLYYCLREGRYWSNPKNLGKSINTRGREKFPVFNEDGKLYYSSDGYKNSAGLDIYYTEFIDGKWIAPTKMGEPYNSSADDFGYIFSKEKNIGFLSSGRDAGIDEIFIIKQAETLTLDYAYLDYVMIMMEIEDDTKVNIYGYSYDCSSPIKCQEKTAKLQKMATDYLMSKGTDMSRIAVKNLGSSPEYNGKKEGTFLTYEAQYEETTSYISNKQLAVSK